MLVIDASAIVDACMARDPWSAYRTEQLIAPPLAFSEVTAALHESQWRGQLTHDEAYQALQHLLQAPVQLRNLESHLLAWFVADELDWAKTYDAEYVALARQLGCRLVTVDARLRRGASRLIEVIGPADL